MTQPRWMRFPGPRPLPSLATVFIIAGLAWAGVKLYVHPPEPLTGTYYGSFTTSARTSSADAVVLHLVQTGQRVTGSLKSEHGRRTANFAGETHDDRLTGMLTFTDPCGGSATVTLALTGDARRLAGSYEARDCEGTHSGQLAILFYWR